MKIQGKPYKFILLTLATACLLSVFLGQSRMNNFRRENNLTHTEPIENLPPTLAFTTVVLGGFRGLIANVLWVRAMQMQEDGKFFEMAQLMPTMSGELQHGICLIIFRSSLMV